jgi:formate dehydrogenase major subunit
MMGARRWIESWPTYRQVAKRDWLGLGAAVKTERSERLAPRVRNADKVVKSVCPYCAVGCGQDVYVAEERGGLGGRIGHPRVTASR